jgi:hypothetical protein
MRSGWRFTPRSPECPYHSLLREGHKWNLYLIQARYIRIYFDYDIAVLDLF